MKWLKYVLIVLAPLLAIAVALSFFSSLDDYIPQIEQEVSARFSGRVGVQLRAAGISSKIPLYVSGTVDAPLLRPTTGTMAGAAVGTVMLGPGLGTSLGARVGGWVERLFGRKEENKQEK